MGIIVSRENQNRTKKVQQTAVVVTALKLASKESKGKGSPSHSPAASRSITTPAGLASSERRNEEFSIEDHDLERRAREHILNLNHDKSSVSYGLPELNAADSLASNSGTTGYWDKTDKAFVSIPYFGAWRRRVGKTSLISSVFVIVLHFLDQLHSLHFLP